MSKALLFLTCSGLLAIALLFSKHPCYGQDSDSLRVKVDATMASKELQDYYRFAGIEYFDVAIKGKTITNNYYSIITREYWNKKITKVDTLINTKRMAIPIKANAVTFKIMAQQTERDSVRFMFFFSNFTMVHKFKKRQENTYSLRDPSNGKTISYEANKPVTLFAYSLPYKDPKRLGFLFYCELSRDGIKPEQWGEKFGIEHYITIELQVF